MSIATSNWSSLRRGIDSESPFYFGSCEPTKKPQTISRPSVALSIQTKLVEFIKTRYTQPAVSLGRPTHSGRVLASVIHRMSSMSLPCGSRWYVCLQPWTPKHHIHHRISTHLLWSLILNPPKFPASRPLQPVRALDVHRMPIWICESVNLWWIKLSESLRPRIFWVSFENVKSIEITVSNVTASRWFLNFNRFVWPW